MPSVLREPSQLTSSRCLPRLRTTVGPPHTGTHPGSMKRTVSCPWSHSVYHRVSVEIMLANAVPQDDATVVACHRRMLNTVLRTQHCCIRALHDMRVGPTAFASSPFGVEAGNSAPGKGKKEKTCRVASQLRYCDIGAKKWRLVLAGLPRADS